MKKTILFLGVIMVSKIYGQGLEAIQNITPQTPEVNSILKAFETPVSLYTGSPDISVPIYTIKEGDINFGLKLSYNSTGITVGERASWVGLGWNLSIPTLVRTVRQIPDDLPNGFFYETEFPVDKVYHTMSVITKDTPLTEYTSICPVCKKIDEKYEAGNLDLESDNYILTLPDGKSISFMVNQERDAQHPIGHIVQFPDSDYKIEYSTTSGNWEITNPQGYQYIYTPGNRMISSHIYSVGGMSIGTEPLTKSIPYTSTWVLSKIISPGKNILNFGYDPIIYEDCDLVNQTKTVNADDSFIPNDGRNYVFTNYSKTKGTNFFINRIWGNFGEVVFNKEGRLDYTIYGKKLSSVEIKNQTGVVVNKIAFDFDYMSSKVPSVTNNCNRPLNTDDITKRLMLKSVRFNVNSSKPLAYQFNYNPIPLPDRMSYARDWWGYYNGEDSNKGLTPSIDVTMEDENKREVRPEYTKAGTLEEIVYPTGGKTKFILENNRGIFHDYNNNMGGIVYYDIIPYKLKTDYFSTREDNTSMLNKVYEFPLKYSSSEITTNVTQTIEIQTNTNQCIYPDSSLPLGNSCAIYYSILDSNNQPIINRALLQDNYSRVLTIGRDKLIAGLKVKIDIYKGKDFPFTQVFDYNQHEANVNIVSKTIDTDYATITPYGSEVPMGGLRIKRIENAESPVQKYIKEYDYKENGIESGLSLFQMDFLQTTPGRLFVASQGNFPLQTGNGSLISYTKATEYNVNPVTNERNSISHVYSNNYIWGSFSGSCFFNEPMGGGINSPSVPCYESALNGKPISVNYSDKKIETYEYPNDLRAGKKLNNVYGIDFDRIIKNSDFMLSKEDGHPFLGIGYFYYQFKNFDEPDYAKEVKEIFNNQELKTNYQYKSLNPNHHQVTHQIVTYSNGSINETQYSYAHEKDNQKLINANMIGIPLETAIISKESLNDSGKMISRTQTKYDDPANLLPTSVLSFDLQNVPSKEVTYDKYDSKGNIQQYTTKDGISTVIIWGYEGTLPIAKIVGAKYSDVNSALIDNIVNSSQTDGALGTPVSEENMINALDGFRNNQALSGYQITTYSYDPLVGVKSVTPPSGIREIYLYDTAGRLKEVREQNNTGKLLKEFNYHYKN